MLLVMVGLGQRSGQTDRLLDAFKGLELVKTPEDLVLRRATWKEQSGDRVFRAVGNPDEQGADRDQVGQREPQLSAVHADARAEAAQTSGILALPTLHELLELPGVSGRVDDVHVQSTVTDLVVEVDGTRSSVITETNLRLEVEYPEVFQHGIAFFDYVDQKLLFRVRAR